MKLKVLFLETCALVGAGLFFFSATQQPALAATLTVCADACDYTSINAAMTASSPADTIHVQTGYDALSDAASLPLFVSASRTLMCDPGVSLSFPADGMSENLVIYQDATLTGCSFGHVRLLWAENEGGSRRRSGERGE